MTTGASIIVIIIGLVIACSILYAIYSLIRGMFAKDSYYYYWRYWNPFTPNRNRYTVNWFLRFGGISFILYGIYYEIFESQSGEWEMIVFWIVLLLMLYGMVTWLIASDDDSQNSYYIKEIKEKLGHSTKKDEVINEEKPSKANESVADELIKLNELKEKGLLTEEEFNEQKKKLLKQ
ncbi:SHOCT domain-containing protein [Flavobacteriales bacterium]|nr:SHOCT domain-containing protein [Flavobacteriales bacterium]